jgi:ABC-2 type transport system permease protein
MGAIFALAAKDLRLLLRDKSGFFFVFFFPLLIAIFFGTLFVNEGHQTNRLKVLVTDEDNTAESRSFVKSLLEAPELEAKLSSRREAADRVRRGEVTAYIVVLRGFAKANIFGNNPPTVELGVDPARKAEQAMIEGTLIKYAAQRLSDLFSNQEKTLSWLSQARSEADKDQNLSTTERRKVTTFLDDLESVLSRAPKMEGQSGSGGGGLQPLRIQSEDVRVNWQGPRSSYEVTFPQGVLWGVLGCAAAFSISLVTERTRGTLVRLRMAPIRRAQILAGKALACFITAFVLSAVLLVFARLVFGVRPASLPKLTLALVATALCFVGIMMLLSVLGRTEQSAGGIGWAVLLVMAMLGGGMIPLFFMPRWLLAVSNFSPMKWAILAIEGAIWRGFSYSEMALPCLVLVGVGAVCFIVGERAFRWLE